MCAKVLHLAIISAITFGVWMAATNYSFGQDFRATIIGQVSDPSGGAIPGATLTLVEISTKTSYTAKTNASGDFSIVYLNPGQYSLTVAAAGFQEKVYPNFTLTATQTLNLNVSLTVGSIRESVTVRAAPGLLETAVGEGTSTIVDSTMLEALPNFGINVWNNTMLAPGVLVAGSLQGEEVGAYEGTGLFPRVNGAGQAADAYFLNGAPINTDLQYNFGPANNSIQELQINSAGGAQYGQASGGNFNAVLKSGTNAFHGMLYSYYSESDLDANSWSNDLLSLGKAFTLNNTWGGNIGGPVILPGYNGRNKTFFFFSYENLYNTGTETFNNMVPTAAMRMGNFQGTGYTVYDPSTVTCVQMVSTGCNQYGRTAFPNDTIPPGDINNLGQEITNMYPSPNLPGVGVNYVRTGPYDILYQQYEARVDHTFSPGTHSDAVVTFAPENNNFNNNGFPGVIGAYDNCPAFDTNVMVDLTQTISNNIVLDLKASFARLTTSWVWGQAFEDDYHIPGLTMPFVPTTPKQNVAPNLTFSNSSGLFENGDLGTASNTWTLAPSISQVIGHHNMQYGFAWEDYQIAPNNRICGLPNGSLNFGTIWSQQNPYLGAGGSGNSAADLLMGYPAGGTDEWCYSDIISRHEWEAYWNDNFKVAKKFTLNLGVRWEANTSPIARHNEMNGPFCFNCPNPYASQIDYAEYPLLPDPLEGAVTFAGVRAPRATERTPMNEWQPRLGFAWSITPKTVFRAGFGIYYNTYATKGATGVGSYSQSDGYDEVTGYIDSLNGGLTPTNYFASGQPWPNGIIKPLGSAGGAYTDVGTGTTYYAQSNRIPWTQHYSAGIQRELPKHILLDVEYVGSHTSGILMPDFFGVWTAQQMNACYQNPSICNAIMPNPFWGVLPVTTYEGSAPTLTYGGIGYGTQDPEMGGITELDVPVGYSTFNSLQVRLERRVKDLYFIFNYNFAHQETADQYENSYIIDPPLFNGPDPQEVVHYVSTALHWPLPIGNGGRFLPNAHGVLGQLLNHWEWNSTVLFQTGFPFQTPSGVNLTGAPGCTSYAAPAGQNQEHWFNNNPACYVYLAQYQLATAPLTVGNVREPSSFAWNAALEKKFALPREGMALEFRVECSYCSNTPQWNNPNTSIYNQETFTPGYGYSGFGAIPLSPYGSRSVQFGLKFMF